MARTYLRELSLTRATFTVDDLWGRLLGGWEAPMPARPASVCAVFQWAQAEGLAVPTGETTPSKRPACHGRPQRVWRSLIFRPRKENNIVH